MHWGNRDTPRPSPRADVLAAAFALSGGDTSTPYTGRLHLAACSPYAARLVAATYEWDAPTSALGWPGLVTAATHEANLRLLRQGSALASILLTGGDIGMSVSLEGGAQVRWMDPTTCRLHPWPFEGRRLTVRIWDPRTVAYRRWTLLPRGG